MGKLLIAIAVALLTPVAAHADKIGDVAGRVVDDLGRPMAGVTVTVSGPPLPAEQTEFTDADGRYLVTELPPGHYTMRFYFSTLKIERQLVVVAEKTATVDAIIPANKAPRYVVRLKEKAPTVDVAPTQVRTDCGEITDCPPPGWGGFRTTTRFPPIKVAQTERATPAAPPSIDVTSNALVTVIGSDVIGTLSPAR